MDDSWLCCLFNDIHISTQESYKYEIFPKRLIKENIILIYRNYKFTLAKTLTVRLQFFFSDFEWFLDYICTMSFPHAFPFCPVVTCTLLMPAPKQSLQMFDTCPCLPELLCNLCNSISGLNQPAGGHRLGDCKNMLPRKPENPQNVTLPDEKSSVSDSNTFSRLNLVSMTFFFKFWLFKKKK